MGIEWEWGVELMRGLQSQCGWELGDREEPRAHMAHRSAFIFEAQLLD